MSQGLPFVSVVIPCSTRPDLLWRCLEGVKKQTHPATRLRAIVAHRGFAPAQKAALALAGVSAVQVSRPGGAHARNAALRLAEGQFVAFLDSDCVPEPEWIEGLLEGFRWSWIGGAGGPVLSSPPRTPTQRYLARQARLGRIRNIELAASREFLFPFVSFQNAMYRLDVVREVGELDEELVSADDADLAWRALLRERQIVYLSKPRVRHHDPETFGAFVRQQFRAGRAIENLMRRYRRFPLRVAGYPHRYRHYARELARSWRDAARGPHAWACSASRWLAIPGGRLWQSAVRALGRELDPRPLPEGGWLWKVSPEGAVHFVSLRSLENFELDEIGSAVWFRIMEGWGPDRILESVLEEYEVDPAEAREGVDALLRALPRPFLARTESTLTAFAARWVELGSRA